MLNWVKHELESRLLGEINNLWYEDDTTLMAESEGTKEPFDEDQKGEWELT